MNIGKPERIEPLIVEPIPVTLPKEEPLPILRPIPREPVRVPVP